MANKTFNLRDAVLVIGDGGATQKTLTLVLDEGDLSITIPQREVKDVRDRGEFDHLRKGSPRPMSFSFSAKYTGLHDAAADTLYKVLTGAGSSWDYTAETGAGYDLLDSGDADVIQLKFTVTKGAASTEIIEIPNIPLPEVSIQEGDEYNTISVSGTSYQELPIITAGT